MTTHTQAGRLVLCDKHAALVGYYAAAQVQQGTNPAAIVQGVDDALVAFAGGRSGDCDGGTCEWVS